jgi:hypothetical protein
MSLSNHSHNAIAKKRWLNENRCPSHLNQFYRDMKNHDAYRHSMFLEAIDSSEYEHAIEDSVSNPDK